MAEIILNVTHIKIRLSDGSEREVPISALPPRAARRITRSLRPFLNGKPLQVRITEPDFDNGNPGG